ncbi:MAG: adenylyltransferase/cytidyltransferase family protein [Candidatus Nomurabacteria bacterium]|nr:adenylyltransferase/cytidyltransferase family protein [Candidatus Nomurabacteria bacterium]
MEIFDELKDKFIKDYEDLVEIVKKAKAGGKTVVLTQGSYDIIHIGHARYLRQAKDNGDIVIVGIDGDSYTTERKGEGRPVIPQNERAEMLLHLPYVDYVTLHTSKEDAIRLIKMIQPDVLVVSESTGGGFVEKMKQAYGGVCGEILGLPPQAETSTSAKVRLIFTQGMHKFRDHVNDLLGKVSKEVDTFVDGNKKGGES